MNMFFGKKYILAVLIFAMIVALSVSTLYFNYSKIKYEVRNSYSPGSKYESITGKIENLRANDMVVENAIKNSIYGENVLLEIYGNFQKLIFKDESRSFEFIKDQKGFIYNGAFYIEKDSNLFEYARRIKRLAENEAEKGTETLFISYPEKSWIAEDYMKGLPIRKYDDVQDEFLADLMKNRVNALDLRISLDRMGADLERIYYKTDKKMTTYGSFRVFQAIVAEIESRFGEDLDPEDIYTDIYNYSVETYPGIFLGDMAVHTGILFSGTDDFEIYGSETKEEYTWSYIDDKGRSFVKSGNKNILFEKNYIKSNNISDNIYDSKLMKVFLNGYNHRDKIVNNKKPDGPKILCIRDENFSPVAIFLAPLCGELHLVNSKTSSNDIEDYIEEEDFDYVLVAFSAGHISNDYFDFFKSK